MSNEPKEPRKDSPSDFIPVSNAETGSSFYDDGSNTTYVIDNLSNIESVSADSQDYYKPKATLESWIDYMKSTPSGINSNLENFLLSSPEYFKTGDEEFAIAPRVLENVSKLMTKLSTATETVDKDVISETIVRALGERFVSDFRKFMGDNGVSQKEYTANLVHQEFSMAEWIEGMEKSKDGLHPLIKDFLLNNSDLYNPNLIEGEGVTPRALGQASDILSRPDRNAAVAQALEDTLGKEVMQQLCLHIQQMADHLDLAEGLEIETTTKRQEKDSAPEL